MRTTCNAIILNRIKYGDNSYIFNAYTYELGKQAFIVNNSNLKRNKNLYHPLQILEIEFNYQENKKLHSIYSANPNYIFRDIPFNIFKSSISVFIAQILNETIREKFRNNELYGYIESSIQYLDTVEDMYSNFHIYFLIKLAKFIGFNPSNNYSKKNIYFNISKGEFCEEKTNSCLGPNASEIINYFLEADIHTYQDIELNKDSRNILIDFIIKYYEYHIERKLNIKSLNIIREIFF